jgi:REP element-mobilizing transposase RayT
MIAGYHLIWTAYGWWLPNDPRGSMSQHVRCAELLPLGDVHYGRKRIQPAGMIIREFYDAARDVLKYPLFKFDKVELETIASSFAKVIRENAYTCYGCAIMPDHVHVLIRKHRDRADAMIEKFQKASRDAVRAVSQPGRGLDHPVWGGPGWKVFLETRADIVRTIRYIEENPTKIGRQRQMWEFVKSYDGWLPGQVRVVKRAKPQAE